MGRSEEDLLHAMPTRELIQHAIDEAKLIAKAEVLHAREELLAEVRNARKASLLLLPAAVLGLCAITVACVLVGLALPIAAVGGLAIIAGFLAIAAALLGAIGYARLPKKPMHNTLRRLDEFIELGREELHS
jgi:hypothetical protein